MAIPLAAIPVADIERRAFELHDQLKGLGPAMQGAVLSHLVATWLAGHRAHADAADATVLMLFREKLLEQHIELVRQLLPHEDKRLGEIRGKRGVQP